MPIRRDDSRWLDEALALWTDDARRAGRAADPEALAQRVISGGAPAPTVERVPWSYAAAAVALLTVGVTGTWIARPRAGSPNPAVVAADLEGGRLDVLRLAEMDRFAPALDREGGR